MNEIYVFLISVGILILAVPIGNFLAMITKEELKDGNKWFNILIAICFLGSLVSLFVKNYVMLFSLLFMIVVVSRSLRKTNTKK